MHPSHKELVSPVLCATVLAVQYPLGISPITEPQL